MLSIRTLAAAALLLTAGLAHAESSRFDCPNVGIVDLSTKTARVSGKKVNGDLDLVSVENVDENGGSQRYVFLGPNASSEYGHIKLELSLPSKEATVFTLDENDMQENVGTVTCKSLN